MKTLFQANIHSAEDARRLARKTLPRMIFDYIDGAAGSGLAAQRNREALDAITLRHRVLKDVSKRDLSGEVFGEKTSLPFGISPMGMCRLSHPQADLALARAAAKYHIPLGVSTMASTPLERLIEEAQKNAWFQFYYSADAAINDALLNRAKASGYPVLVLSVDSAAIGRRPRELRWQFKMPFRPTARGWLDLALHPRWSLSTLFAGAPGLANFDAAYAQRAREACRASADFDFLRKLRDQWPGKLVVKGVSDAEDAKKIQALGADAIQVSNHGGRQLGSAAAALDSLVSIRHSVGSDYPLFFDSGLRSGEDVLKAYASGADFVFLGRPLLFAMAAGGERGLSAMLAVFAEELSIGMALAGVTVVGQVGGDCLVERG